MTSVLNSNAIFGNKRIKLLVMVLPSTVTEDLLLLYGREI